MKQVTKRYIQSTTITFLTGFCTVLLTDIDKLNVQSFIDGSYVGLLFSAVRSGVKALIEAFIVWKSNNTNEPK